MLDILASASLGRTITDFFDAVGSFFSNLAAVHWSSLLVGLLFFAANLTLRSRAIFNSLRAAYPAVRFQWRRIWGAYFAAVGLDNVVPARGGDVVKIFLTKSSIPDSTYATVAAAVLPRRAPKRRLKTAVSSGRKRTMGRVFMPPSPLQF